MAGVNTANDLLQCPIRMELFDDPVIAEDGHTYERQAIEEWIQKHGTSPNTREPLSIEQLRPNRIVIDLVNTFKKSMQENNYQFILNVHVKKKEEWPIFQAFGKTIYRADWLPDNNNRPEIILLRIEGARAKKEALFYVNLSRHPHIIRTFGFVHDENIPDQDITVLLLQEYAPRGNFYELLRNRRTAPEEKVLIQIFLQIIEAMIYLAYNKVVHGDLACRNVLVFRFDDNQPERNVVKIADFGLSRDSPLYARTSDAASTTLYTLPVRYAAPEVLSTNTTSQVYTEKSDVYSMGVLMWEAYSRGSIPWGDTDDSNIIRRITNGDLLTQPSNCSQPFWSIITKTWSRSPSDRPTFSELKHLLTEQYYRSGWMSPSNSQRFQPDAKHDPGVGKTKEVQQQQEERNRRIAQQQQEERNRRIAQQQQGERDRKIAQQQQEERDRKIAQQQQEERNRRIAQQQQKERDRRKAQQQQEERDRKIAQRQQEEEDRKLAQEYASREKRAAKERVGSAAQVDLEPVQSMMARYQLRTTGLSGVPMSQAVTQYPEVTAFVENYDRDYVHGDPATRSRYAHTYANFARAHPNILPLPTHRGNKDPPYDVPHPRHW